MKHRKLGLDGTGSPLLSCVRRVPVTVADRVNRESIHDRNLGLPQGGHRCVCAFRLIDTAADTLPVPLVKGVIATATTSNLTPTRMPQL